MPYWKFADYKNNAPSIPLYVYGETFDFSMVFVNDTEAAWQNSYLFVNKEFIDCLFVKLASEGESAYRLVMGNQDPNAYVGILPVGETQIDFRLKNTGVLTGLRNLYIPVYVSHDDGAPMPVFVWLNVHKKLWEDCYSFIEFWRDSYGGVDVTADCVSDLDMTMLTDALEPTLFEDSLEPELWG